MDQNQQQPLLGFKTLSEEVSKMLAALGLKRFSKIPLLQEASEKEVLIEQIKQRFALREKVIDYSGRPSDELERLKVAGMVIPPTPTPRTSRDTSGISDPNPDPTAENAPPAPKKPRISVSPQSSPPRGRARESPDLALASQGESVDPKEDEMPMPAKEAPLDRIDLRSVDDGGNLDMDFDEMFHMYGCDI